MSEINLEKFKEIDLIVGEIEKVEEMEGSLKLYKLVVDIGDEKRQVVAGIKQYYRKEDLLGKKVILLANLEAKEIRGVMSHGMILAGSFRDIDGSNKLGLVTLERAIPNGVKIG